jgi:hypothetical protein
MSPSSPPLPFPESVSLARIVLSPDVQEATTYASYLTTFHVTDPESFLQADQILGALKTRIDKLHLIFDPICQAADRAHKEACAKRAEQIGPLDALKTRIGSEAAGWQREQEDFRLAEEARLQALADHRGTDQQIAAAAQAEAEGDHALASAILDQAVTDTGSTPLILPSTTPKLKHSSFTRRFKAKVVDKLRLIQAVSAGQVPLAALDANIPYLDMRASREQAALNIPGVVAVPKDSTRVRG